MRDLLETIKLQIKNLYKKNLFIAYILFYQEKRYAMFIERKKQISDLMLEMERSPDTAFEREIVTEDESRFILSTDNMSSLEAVLAEVLDS